jgi:bacterioferritin (cytochrome b1)
MGSEILIEVLNDLVSVEIAAVTEYQQHAYLSEISRVTDLMEDFSMDEMSHIEWLSREVRRLGGTPTVTPKDVKYADESLRARVI